MRRAATLTVADARRWPLRQRHCRHRLFLA